MKDCRMESENNTHTANEPPNERTNVRKKNYIKSCELYEYDILISCSIDIYYIENGAYDHVVQNQCGQIFVFTTFRRQLDHIWSLLNWNSNLINNLWFMCMQRSLMIILCMPPVEWNTFGCAERKLSANIWERDFLHRIYCTVMRRIFH